MISSHLSTYQKRMTVSQISKIWANLRYCDSSQITSSFDFPCENSENNHEHIETILNTLPSDVITTWIFNDFGPRTSFFSRLPQSTNFIHNPPIFFKSLTNEKVYYKFFSEQSKLSGPFGPHNKLSYILDLTFNSNLRRLVFRKPFSLCIYIFLFNSMT